VIFFFSILPGILWVWFFSAKDVHREPPAMLMKTFVAGVLAVIPAAILEIPLRPYLIDVSGVESTLLLALLAIGLVEEGVKLGAAYLTAFRSPLCDEPVDGVIYAVTAALGFAAAENTVYTLAYGTGVALIRAVLTSLAHASFAGIFGVAAGLIKAYKLPLSAIWPSFIVAVLLHATYDFFIVLRIVPSIIAILLVYAIYRYVISKLHELQGMD
jgi:RsiW-degrading membrane proteinase PrsW (M82 family)